VAATQTPELADFLEELGLPSDMDNRDADRSKLVEEFEADVRAQLGSRRFAPGLAMALLAVAEEALATAGEDSVDDPLEEFEHEETTSRGRPVNTLNLIVGEKTVRLRPHYNKVQHVYQSLLRRYDYPNMPGHATQAWRQHQDMLRRAFAMTPEERLAAAEAVWTIVLDEFPEHRRRSTADA
jgi:hypothetical protein